MAREPTYRFFGTDRVISEFLMDIMVETADQPAGCTTWGSVSYTSEADFHRYTTDDIVRFYIMVPQATYDRYIWNIAQGLADELYLSVGFVGGFYSAWSPSISTHEIKVLAGSEHVIEGAKDAAMPRLGKVGKAELFMNARCNLMRSTATLAEELENEEAGAEARSFRWPGRRR